MSGVGVQETTLHPLVEESRFQGLPTRSGLLDCIGFTLDLVDKCDRPLLPALEHGKARLEEIAETLERDGDILIRLKENEVDFQLKNNLGKVVGFAATANN